MPEFDMYVPRDLRDALKFLEEEGKRTTILAGGTDLVPRLKRRQVVPQVLLDISGLQGDLRYIRREGDVLRLGCLTTISDVLESELLGGGLGMFKQAAQRFGAPQVRNVATIGGNVASATSSEDFIPVLLSLRAKVKLLNARGERSLPLEELIVGKRALARAPHELLSEVNFQVPHGNFWSGFEKLGRRNSLAIALVSMALFLALEDDLETVKDVGIALNRVSGKVPQRALEAEGKLKGQSLSPSSISLAQSALASELNLKGDYRASGWYRTEVALVQLRRLLESCYVKARGG
jgi:CO/xanthine dehydrogenase FAD-binding subunit